MKILSNSIIRYSIFGTILLWASLALADPTTQPRVQPGDITYLGSFTMPGSFDAEVRGLGISADGQQLYVGQYPSKLGLVNIPAIGGTATQVIPPTTVPGTIGGSSPEPEELAGVFVHNGRLIVSKRFYWDEQGTSGGSHAFGSTNISGFKAFTRMDNAQFRQYTNGYIGAIPAEWQSLLGGPAFAGNSLMSLLQGNSNGPSFYVFDPDDVGAVSPIPSEPLMLYPFNDSYSTSLLGQDLRKTNDYIVASDQENAGIVFPSGTRSVLFFYRHGYGTPCYGTAAQCSNDPCNPYHGEHGYPYRRQIAAFDANELLAVKNGSKNYYDVVPYAWWEVPGIPSNGCGGFQYSALAYDDASRRIYVATENYYSTHKIHVLQVADGTPSTTDSTPAILTNGTPSGTLASGTTQATMSLNTNEKATCRWSVSPNTSFDNMTNTFTTTGSTAHSIQVTGLTDGSSQTRYVRCVDSAGNTNTNDYVISWTVATSSVPSGGRLVNVANLTQLYNAFADLRDGDEIVIAPGTYNLNTSFLVINKDNVTIRGASGNRDDVIIRGDAMSAGANIKTVFYFPQGPYGQNAVIKDLSAGRVGWHVIMFNGNGAGNGSIVDNVKLFDSYEQLLKATVDVSGSDNVTIKNSLFVYTAGIGPQYYIGGVDTLGAESWTIQGNVFKDIESPSNTISNPAIHLWSNDTFAGNMIVERNRIINCDRGIGIWNGTGANVVRNNMIASDGSNLFSDVGIDIQNTPNTKVYNNTVWIEGSYPNAIELRGTSTVNSLVVNNLTSRQIFLFNGASGTVSNNVDSALSTWFVNPSESDLHLTSAATGVKGTGRSVVGLTDDFDGQPRSGSIDIGADQTMSSLSPPRNLRIINP